MRAAPFLATLLLLLPFSVPASGHGNHDDGLDELATVVLAGSGHVAFRLSVGGGGGVAVLDVDGGADATATWLGGSGSGGSFLTDGGTLFDTVVRAGPAPAVSVRPATGGLGASGHGLPPGEHVLVAAVGADADESTTLALRGSANVTLVAHGTGGATLVRAEDFDGLVALARGPLTNGYRLIQDAFYPVEAQASLYVAFAGGALEGERLRLGLDAPGGSVAAGGACVEAACRHWIHEGDLGAGAFTLRIHEARGVDRHPVVALVADVAHP